MDVTKTKAQPAQQVQAPKKSEEVQQAKRQEAQVQAQRAQEQKAAENKPRPNVNGQGQTIGTRLSVTA
jgi:regulator of protease activity HflC (stomatin/prohibitin superfamily)